MWVVALVVHAVVASLWVSEPHGYDPSVSTPWRDFLPVSLGVRPQEVVMHFRQRDGLRAPPAVMPRRVPDAGVNARVARLAPTESGQPAEAPRTAVVPTDDGPPTPREARLGPRYGEGRLWARPLSEAPNQLAQALTGRSQAELVDSAVDAIVQQYLDAMAKEAIARQAAVPSWTTTVAGQRVGLDTKWLYLGPLKVPSFLLGFLPINLQGNPTQAEFNAKLMVMREDIFRAAQRADNLAEFKKAVKQLRQDKQGQREFEKNQRTRPDSSVP